MIYPNYMPLVRRRREAVIDHMVQSVWLIQRISFKWVKQEHYAFLPHYRNERDETVLDLDIDLTSRNT